MHWHSFWMFTLFHPFLRFCTKILPISITPPAPPTGPARRPHPTPPAGPARRPRPQAPPAGPARRHTTSPKAAGGFQKKSRGYSNKDS